MAASGHNINTSQMNLQSMVRIESEHPVVYQKLVDGFHVV